MCVHVKFVIDEPIVCKKNADSHSRAQNDILSCLHLPYEMGRL